MTVPTATRPLFDPAFLRDPYPILAALRRDAAAHPVETPNGLRTWLVVRYDDARTLLNDPRLSKDMSVGHGLIPGNFVDEAKRAEFLRESGTRRQFPVELSRHMLDSDPPDHTRLRGLVGRAFTARRVAALRPRVAELVDQLLDVAEPGPEVELMAALAFPVPFTVICWLLGVPPADRQNFRTWSNLLVSGTGGDDVLDASQAMVDYLRHLIAAKRRDRADDLLGALVEASDGGDRLSEDELMAMAFLLLVAGHETTVNLIGNGTLALLTHPEERARVVADPSLWPAAIEEFLRFDGPVTNATWRFTTTEVRVGDVTIPEGEFVTICLGAAGRDPDRYDAPDVLDVTRPQSANLAFGHGIHHCLGAPLARMEAEIVLSRLFSRYPDLRLAVPTEDLRWRFSLMLRGLEQLPVLVR
ncbi:cytochrome P450 [Micromonospora soli]|uniref:cytochrome P450 family protein n=1 Tax=Micromonospora sp. NBRC 110009 TaxID=3061627 RepID=UPI002672CF0E|nr:cytochrome P450 [Micromonospora sp. NBRC 110009]WKU00445.1 cytochrome P450 [Micromonospora sp. NBRC 110009]